MFSIICHTTNQPTSPISTKPPMKVMEVASPRGTPPRWRRPTTGWSSAVISSAATKASTTSAIALMTRISTYRVPARIRKRQAASAATRTPHGTAVTGSRGAATAGA